VEAQELSKNPCMTAGERGEKNGEGADNLYNVESKERGEILDLRGRSRYCEIPRKQTTRSDGDSIG